jgi:dextranase
MRALLLFLLIALIRGENVSAVTVFVDVVPDKAFYHPGEPVRLAVSAAGGDSVSARISFLAEPIAELNAPVVSGSAELVWTPPSTPLRGYGLDLFLLDEDSTVLASASTAFDVLDRWTQAPRYGFLSEFTPQRPDPDTTMAWAARYHLNGLQFYDWQYRHETLLPPTDAYSDVLGRSMSLPVVRSLIDAAHAHNIAAMPYTAIYGASAAFYREHPDWALFRAPGLPYEFGDNFLIIMNPAPDSLWIAHLLNEYSRVLDETTFDGIHIDQYGAPMRGRSASGALVRLDEAFPAFINATAALVQQKRGDDGTTIFNAVRNWPLAAVAPAQQDAVYIEVWEPYRSFLDLYRIIGQAQQLGGGKPVIIAAYIHPERTANVRLANALIFASGGYHIELGEPNAMLADPYFPNFALMDETTQAVARRYYDFLVRYENLLSLNTTDATADRAEALTIEGITTQSTRSRDRVAVIVRQSDNRETFSLINLLGIDGEYWDSPLSQPPTPIENLHVRFQTSRPVVSVYASSPDQEDLGAQPVDFTRDEDSITFVLERLEYWHMIVVEYES